MQIIRKYALSIILGIALISSPFALPESHTRGTDLHETIFFLLFGACLIFLSVILTKLDLKKEPIRPIDFKELNKMDLALICYMVPVSILGITGYLNNIILLFGCIVAGNILLITWLVKGGEKSKLWDFMPPFYPWGKIINFKAGRWAITLLLCFSSLIGLAMIINEKT